MTAHADTVEPGHLYVVATPIGNLGDLSPRALKILDSVDHVAAEDTRVSGALLAHFGVRKRMTALHEHNEDEASAGLIDELKKGRSVALVSDAGTPLISDPGFSLVRSARKAGIPVIAVPGACAAIAALSVSGLPTDRFVFAGFVPAKAEARRHLLESLAAEPRTVVLYESTHRIEDSLRAIVDVLGGQRRICLARELTKLHEESHTASAAELLDWLHADADRQRGEFVLVVEGVGVASGDEADAVRILRVLLPEMGTSRAAKLAAQLTGLPRKRLYELALTLGGEQAEPGAGDV